MLGTVRFVGPPEAFYSAALTVIAALQIALAIELRLLRPRKKPLTLPETAAERRRVALTALVWVMFPLASFLGLLAGIGALYHGGTRSSGAVTLVGLSVTVALFAIQSLRIFARAMGGFLPFSSDRQKLVVLLIIGVLAVLALLFQLRVLPS